MTILSIFEKISEVNGPVLIIQDHGAQVWHSPQCNVIRLQSRDKTTLFYLCYMCVRLKKLHYYLKVAEYAIKEEQKLYFSTEAALAYLPYTAITSIRTAPM